MNTDIYEEFSMGTPYFNYWIKIYEFRVYYLGFRI